MIFEKSSIRTRCAFEVAAHDQGADVSGDENNALRERDEPPEAAVLLGHIQKAAHAMAPRVAEHELIICHSIDAVVDDDSWEYGGGRTRPVPHGREV